MSDKIVPSQGKREQTKALNREAILNSARQCFLEHGFEGTTIRDISRRTGLAPGTFYNYFTEKESVFRAILDDYLASLSRSLHVLRENATTIDEFIESTMLAFFQSVSFDPVAFRLMLRNREIVNTLYAGSALALAVDVLRKDITVAIERRILPPVNVDHLTHAFIGIGYELGSRLIQEPNPDPIQYAKFASSLFLGGIKTLPTIETQAI